MPRTTKLAIHPREMVLALLQAQSKPLAAYDLLHLLKESGVNSPPIIYRALQELEAKGLVHKLSSINAYIACNDSCKAKRYTLVTVCAGCKTSHEIDNPLVSRQLGLVKENGINLKERSVIELPITCEACA